MSGSEQQIILVRATAKRNGITSLVIGGGLLLLSVIWLAVAPDYLTLPGIFLTSAAIVCLLIGWFKIREPDHSIEITPNQITYRHRLGQWHIAWKEIQRFDQPRVLRGIEHKDLEVIGIKIKDYETFISNISPRLATHILMEQRPLLMQNPDKNCATGTCTSGDFIEDTKFKLDSGKMLSGVQAMLANRMARLRDSLGYDVYVSASDLDREPAAFITLLKECQQARLASLTPD
jgi:hypothetical protein